MSHHHHHEHPHHHHHSNNRRVLQVSLALIAGFMLVEAVAGWLSHSLALLSDAGHMFSDAAAIALSLAAFHFGSRAADGRRSFGYRRFEVIAAALNGLTLLLMAVWIVWEAVQRLNMPQPISATTMLVVAVLGLVVNVLVAGYMLRHGDTQDNLNMRSAYLHVLGDLLGSIGAIGAGVLILAFGWYWADPVISLLIALLIGKSGWQVAKSSLHILMEGTPAHIDSDRLLQAVVSVDGVAAVHDLHAWTLTSSSHALSCHIVVAENLSVAEAYQIVRQVEQAVQALGIDHVTVQAEPPQHGHPAHGCCVSAAEHQHPQTTHTHHH